MSNHKLIGVGTNNELYTRDGLNGTWVKVPNSGSVTSVTVLKDGTIKNQYNDSCRS